MWKTLPSPLNQPLTSQVLSHSEPAIYFHTKLIKSKPSDDRVNPFPGFLRMYPPPPCMHSIVLWLRNSCIPFRMFCFYLPRFSLIFFFLCRIDAPVTVSRIAIGSDHELILWNTASAGKVSSLSKIGGIVEVCAVGSLQR